MFYNNNYSKCCRIRALVIINHITIKNVRIKWPVQNEKMLRVHKSEIIKHSDKDSQILASAYFYDVNIDVSVRVYILNVFNSRIYQLVFQSRYLYRLLNALDFYKNHHVHLYIFSYTFLCCAC